MPGANLTRVEAQERSEIVANPLYTVELDLTVGPKNFISNTTLTFDAKQGASSFLDLIADSVEKITLNGKELNPAQVFVDSRIELSDLAEHNTVEVLATCQYSNTGEGLHRSIDPSDGNIYLYSQFEGARCRRVYAVFDQPDLKATFNFTVEAPQSWEVISNMPVASVNNIDV
jgi:aminopeptidase N